MTDEIVCRIDALSHDGRGLHRPEDGGPVIFVAGSLPGQTVRARIIRRQKRFWEAQRTAVLEDVALAADICPHGEDCGGCPWQRLPYAAQLRWKGQLVRDALERIGGLGRDAALPLRPALGSPEQRAFRNKMEFAFGPADGSGLCLGLRRRGGLQVLPVPGCALPPGEGLELVTACAGLAARSGLPAYVPAAQRPPRKAVCGPGRKRIAGAAPGGNARLRKTAVSGASWWCATAGPIPLRHRPPRTMLRDAAGGSPASPARARRNSAVPWPAWAGNCWTPSRASRPSSMRNVPPLTLWWPERRACSASTAGATCRTTGRRCICPWAAAGSVSIPHPFSRSTAGPPNCWPPRPWICSSPPRRA